MTNIQISESEARSIRSLFNTNGWETYISVMHKARAKARDMMESSVRDDKTRQFQGACLMLKEICRIESDITGILKSDNN